MLAPEFSALRCLFLLAMHHGLHMAPEELPTAQGPALLPAVLDALRRLGLKTRALTGRGWDTAAGLGSAYPALAVRRDGSWVVLVHVIPGPDGALAVAVLDPATEAEGVGHPARAFRDGRAWCCAAREWRGEATGPACPGSCSRSSSIGAGSGARCCRT